MEEMSPKSTAADAEPLTLPDAEQQLFALAQQLSARLEALSQAENARQEALDTREEQLRRREVTARAREALAERGLPPALADCLSFPDEEALRQGVDALEAAFRAAVQQAVDERLLADPPRSAAPAALSDLSDEDYYAAVCRND